MSYFLGEKWAPIDPLAPATNTVDVDENFEHSMGSKLEFQIYLVTEFVIRKVVNW